eukprot:UN17761
MLSDFFIACNSMLCDKMAACYSMLSTIFDLYQFFDITFVFFSYLTRNVHFTQSIIHRHD